MKVPSKNPPFFQGGCCRTFHEPLRFFEFPRSNALDTPYRWSDEDELQHGQLGFPTCIGYRHQDIYIYNMYILGPISNLGKTLHFPPANSGEGSLGNCGPLVRGRQTWRVIHGFYPGIATPLKFPEV